MNHRHTLTIDRDLFETIGNRARANRRSINQEILYLIECAMVMEVARNLEVRRLVQQELASQSTEYTETDDS